MRHGLIVSSDLSGDLKDCVAGCYCAQSLGVCSLSQQRRTCISVGYAQLPAARAHDAPGLYWNPRQQAARVVNGGAAFVAIGDDPGDRHLPPRRGLWMGNTYRGLGNLGLVGLVGFGIPAVLADPGVHAPDVDPVVLMNHYPAHSAAQMDPYSHAVCGDVVDPPGSPYLQAFAQLDEFLTPQVLPLLHQERLTSSVRQAVSVRPL